MTLPAERAAPPAHLEIRHHPLGDFVRWRLLIDDRYCTDGLMRPAAFETFRAACPGIEFREDERRAVGEKR